MEKQLSQDRNLFLKQVSAISLAILGKRDSKILFTLIEYIKGRPQEMEDKFSDLPGEDISINRDILSLIAQFPREETVKILDKLIVAFEKNPVPLDVFVKVFTSIAFGEEKRTVSIHDLTEQQRKVLMAIANCPACWTFSNIPLFLHNQLGLPFFNSGKELINYMT